MRVIRSHSLGYAHEAAVKDILENGIIRKTENSEMTLETDVMHIEVKTPLQEPMISPSSPQQRRYVDEYARQILYGTPGKFEYDYHERLFEWGKMLGDGVNQIKYITDKLQHSPESRRAVAVTWVPPFDTRVNDVPCLQLLQCVIQNGKLNQTVVFRSNDMLSALGANMYGFTNLQMHIANTIGISIGTYTHISIVPHIYYIRDVHEVRNVCLGMNMNGRPMRPQDVVCKECKGCLRGCS